MHWADAPSLRLIRHLASGITDSRLLLLITYRDTETGGRPELTSLLAALSPMDAVHRVRLTGLSHDEVACQLAAVAGHPVAAELATAISRRTHGNPFFVAELGRLLGARAGSADALAAALPEAVRDTVRARLDALSGACRTLLCAAAVLSADIDPAAGRDRAGPPSRVGRYAPGGYADDSSPVLQNLHHLREHVRDPAHAHRPRGHRPRRPVTLVRGHLRL